MKTITKRLIAGTLALGGVGGSGYGIREGMGFDGGKQAQQLREEIEGFKREAKQITTQLRKANTDLGRKNEELTSKSGTIATLITQLRKKNLLICKLKEKKDKS